ncbi:hypothetical protein ACFLZX_05545, partial [Nanoarchaeota archaeon]
MNEDLAELYGVMIGDGCLTISKSNNRRYGIAHITGHLKHDWDYYQSYIRPIVQREFKLNGSLQKREEYNCLYF